jgi:uncharacterized protein YycO
MIRMFALLLVIAAAACSRSSVLVKRPEDKKVDAAVTQMWTSEIGNVARDGDWILTRSYVLVGDVISTVVPGESLSHASIYDAKTGTVIEAVSEGIREIPLSKLVARNHYVIVVRPTNMSATEQTDAVARARTKLGGKFDISGMFGIDHADAFYCSELVYWASQTEARSGRRERIVTPADLMKYGEVIYWSGKRDDSQVMSIAASRS